jgi:hypothetical protein
MQWSAYDGSTVLELLNILKNVHGRTLVCATQYSIRYKRIINELAGVYVSVSYTRVGVSAVA